MLKIPTRISLIETLISHLFWKSPYRNFLDRTRSVLDATPSDSMYDAGKSLGALYFRHPSQFRAAPRPKVLRAGAHKICFVRSLTIARRSPRRCHENTSFQIARVKFSSDARKILSLVSAAPLLCISDVTWFSNFIHS